MLLRLITSISLLSFALLMMSGTQVDQALYRSLVIFMMLFAALYLTIFLINVLQETTAERSPGATSASGKSASNGSKNYNGSGTTSGKSHAGPRGEGFQKNSGNGPGAANGSSRAGAGAGPGATGGKSGADAATSSRERRKESSPGIEENADTGSGASQQNKTE